jgi:hypothetical protein
VEGLYRVAEEMASFFIGDFEEEALKRAIP